MADDNTVRLRLLIQATDNASKVVNDLQKRLNEVSESAKKLAGSSEEAGKKGKEGIDEYSKAATKAQIATKKLSEAMNGMGMFALKLGAIAASISASVAIPIVTASGLEKALAKVVAVTKNAEEEFDSLKGKAAELGRTTTKTAAEVAEGMVFLGMAGMEASQVVEAIGPSLRLAAASGTDLATSADIVTNIVSAMRLETSDLADAVDVLAASMSNANTNLIELAEAVKYAGPLAAAAKISMEELAAMIGVLGNNGIKGSQAGTSLNNMIRSLLAPSSKAREALSEMGVSISMNADGSLDLVDALHQLADANMNAAQANAIFGRYAAAGSLAITASIDELDKLIVVNKSAAGTAEKMAKIMKDNLRGAITKLTSAFEGLREVIGGPFLKPLQSLVELFAKVVNAITDLIEKLPVATNLFAYMTMGAIALLTVIGTLAGAMSILSKTLEFLVRVNAVDFFVRLGKAMFTAKAAVTETALAVRGANVAIHGMTGSVGVLTLSVQALMAAFKQLVAFLAKTPLGIFLLVTAVIGTLAYAFAEWRARLGVAIKENKKMIASLSESGASIKKMTDDLKDAEEGSEEYAATSKSLRTRILELADSNEDLRMSALEAASSIDQSTGAIRDNGEAISELQRRIDRLTLDKMAERIELLAEKARRAKVEAYNWGIGINGVRVAYAMLQDLTNKDFGMPRTVAAIAKGFDKVNKVLKEIDIQAEGYINKLKEIDQYDPDLGEEELRTLLITIQGVNEDMVDSYIKAYYRIKKETEKTVKQRKQLERFDADALIAEVDRATESVRRLTAAYKEAKAASEIDPSGANVQGRIDAYNAMESAQIATIENIEAYWKKADEKEENRNTARLKKIERDATIEEQLVEQKNANIAEEDLLYQKNSLEILDQVNERINETIDASQGFVTPQLEALQKKLRLAYKAMLTPETGKLDAAELAEGDARILLNRRVQEALTELERKGRDMRIDLMKEGTEKEIKAKFEAKTKAEIEDLREEGKRRLLSAKQLKPVEDAIREKNRREELEAVRKLEEEKIDLRAEFAQQSSDQQLEILEAAYQGFQISGEQFVRERVDIQLKAIDAQIQAVKDKIAALKKTIYSENDMLQLEITLKVLEGAKGVVKTQGGADLEAEARKQRRLELQQGQEKIRQQIETDTFLESLTQEHLDRQLEMLRTNIKLQTIALEEAGWKKKEIAEWEKAELEKIEKKDKPALGLEQTNQILQETDKYVNILGDTFAKFYDATGKKSKELFYLEKAAAIASVIIKTQEAIMNVYAKYEGNMALATGLAALITAQGTASIAVIAAQQMARGGEVKGRSPKKDSDNIPIMATAKEWVMPIDTVKKYGKNVMEGLRRGLIPVELFQGMRLPTPVPVYSGGYASGGEVKSASSRATSAPTGGDKFVQPVNIINVIDPNEMDRYLNTSAGQSAILNVLSSRSDTVKRIMR